VAASRSILCRRTLVIRNHSHFPHISLSQIIFFLLCNIVALAFFEKQRITIAGYVVDRKFVIVLYTCAIFPNTHINIETFKTR
jgi:hypothetical protein